MVVSGAIRKPEKVPIDPRRVPFRASHVLKSKINKMAGLSD